MEKKSIHRLSACALAVLACGTTQSSLAAIEIGQGFSAIGQFDAGYRFTDADAENSEQEQTFSTNEFQIDLDYTHADSGLYAHLELEGRTNDNSANQFRTEAAFIGRNFDNGAGFKMGKFISPSGYEGAEPWDRFGRTTAFGGIFAYLQNGVAGYYQSGIFNVYGALVDGAWTGDNDITDPSAEVQFGITTDKSVTRLTMAYEQVDAEDLNDDGVADTLEQDHTMVNLWSQYTLGELTMAAEYNYLTDMNRALTDTTTAWDGQAWMVFAKYSLSPAWKLGVRYSEAQYDDIDGNSVSDSSEFTITPRYQVLSGDVNWDFRADFRFQDGDNEIAGVEDGFLFEVGTTLKF